MKNIVLCTCALLAMALTVGTAEAHTTAFGYVSQSNGDVDFYIGTYDHGNAPLQGSLVVSGSPGGGTYAFTQVFNNTTATALGLTGPNSFYQEYTGSGTNVDFQKVTVSGLATGNYSFDLAGMSSAFWLETGVFPFPRNVNVQVQQQAVPEPASLTLFGLGAIGMAVAVRRRRKKQQTQTA